MYEVLQLPAQIAAWIGVGLIAFAALCVVREVVIGLRETR